ncbi:MAG TPA: helix-turn-helix domain-containing protein [Candidatus Nitrosopolaris sp.]|nr:helix-turn-helix domain-containing protein [Candidatus Nitrosopolaris sp.]
MPHRRPPVAINRLPAALARLGISWSELGRRTLLPPRLLARLRSPAANPRLAVAERVADALALQIEDLWILPAPHGSLRRRKTS